MVSKAMATVAGVQFHPPNKCARLLTLYACTLIYTFGICLCFQGQASMLAPADVKLLLPGIKEVKPRTLGIDAHVAAKPIVGLDPLLW